MKKWMLTLAVTLSAMAMQAKTLVVYYSFTNNVHTIVQELAAQTGADVLRIEPAEEGLDYAANNYAIGSALIAAIRSNPDEASSYPEIKTTDVNLSAYDCIIVAAPLWWSNMAAPLQTFLFHHGAEMADKKIGLIVSSASSGISGVEADAHRLIPEGQFLTPSLWIRSSQTSGCRTMLQNWLEQIDYNSIASDINSLSADRSARLRVTPDAIYLDGPFNRLSLFDASGRKMWESSARTVRTSTLSPGTYVAHIRSRARTFSRKIVIKK